MKSNFVNTIMDLEKFFDKVNHDKLMQVLNKTIEEAWALANTRKGIMHRSKSLNNFITNKTLALKGLVSMFEYYTTRINLNVH